MHAFLRVFSVLLVAKKRKTFLPTHFDLILISDQKSKWLGDYIDTSLFIFVYYSILL